MDGFKGVIGPLVIPPRSMTPPLSKQSFGMRDKPLPRLNLPVAAASPPDAIPSDIWVNRIA